MLNFIWPIALVVFSNVLYQIAAKSTPPNMNPFISLTVTYVVAAVVSFVMFLIFGKSDGLLKELSKANWASYALGIVIIGLETGFIYAYKAGWQVSTASIVQSSFLAVALIVVGFLLYKEPLTFNKIAGVIVCLIGLVIINIK